MAEPRIVRGQFVSDQKVALARRLRRETTPTERALWRRLRGSRMSGLHFRRQQVIDGFVVDFYCHAARLVIEVDGPVHDRQREYDDARDAVIAARNLTVIRISNDDVERDIADVLRRIASAAGVT